MAPSVETLEIKTRNLNTAFGVFREAILQAGREGKLSQENFDRLDARIQPLLTKISNAKINLPQADLAAQATELDRRLDSYFAELDTIGSDFAAYTGGGNPVTKYREAMVQAPPTTMNPILKWALIAGVGVLAFKYLWNRAGKPEYPRAQLPGYAGGHRRGDDGCNSRRTTCLTGRP
jgi:hypothetical protein